MGHNDRIIHIDYDPKDPFILPTSVELDAESEDSASIRQAREQSQSFRNDISSKEISVACQRGFEEMREVFKATVIPVWRSAKLNHFRTEGRQLYPVLFDHIEQCFIILDEAKIT